MSRDITSKERAYAYLEGLQRALFATLGLSAPPPLPDEETIRERFARSWTHPKRHPATRRLLTPEEAAEEFLQLLRKANPPTRFEDPGVYASLYGFAEGIRESVPPEVRPELEKVGLGTLPTGRANAMALRVPHTDDYLVVFEWGLMNFTMRMSHILALTVCVSQGDGQDSFSWKADAVRSRVRDNPEFTALFQDVLGTYLLRGYVPRSDDTSDLNQPRDYFQGAIWGGMMSFLVSHEYAHVIDGHLARAEQRSVVIGDERATEVVHPWSHEFIADSMGLVMMVRTAQHMDFDPVFAFIGAYLFFLLHDILDRGISILVAGVDCRLKQASHPPPEFRRMLLENVLKTYYEDRGAPEWGEKTVLMATHVKETTNVLFDEIRPKLQEWHDEGRRPTRLWRDMYDKAIDRWRVT